MSHVHSLLSSLFNDGHSSKSVIVTRVQLLHSLEMVMVNGIHDDQMSGEHLLEQRNRPSLQGFRKDSVVGVSECAHTYIPSLFPRHLLDINENPHHFWNCKSRVSVVQLNCCLLREFLKVRPDLFS